MLAFAGAVLASRLGQAALLAGAAALALWWLVDWGGDRREERLTLDRLEDHAETVKRKNRIEKELRDEQDDGLRDLLGIPNRMLGPH